MTEDEWNTKNIRKIVIFEKRLAQSYDDKPRTKPNRIPWMYEDVKERQEISKKLMDGWMDGLIDGWINRYKDRWMD